MVYEIIDADGNAINAIVADEAFMLTHFPEGNYRLRPEVALD